MGRIEHRSLTAVVRGLVAAMGACALLGLASSEALATHVACGQTIVADTTLDSDLTNCPGHGVVIGASGVSLDLGGHTIDGVSFNESAGVRFRDVDDVEVKNGGITDFEYGVHGTSSASGSHVTQLDVRRIDYGIDFCCGGGDFLIDHNTISETAWRGISVFEGTAGAGSGTVVEDNVVVARSTNAPVYGITVAGIENVVRRNSASGYQNGIGIGSGDLNLVADNILSDNDAGISMGLGGDFNQVLRNSISASTYDGIRIVDSFENHVADNSVHDSGRDGISLDIGFRNGSDRNVIEGNEVVGSGGGINLDDSHFNVIEGNEVVASGVGIDVDSESESNKLIQNSVSQSAGDGIWVHATAFEATNNELTGNESFGNGDDGIDVDAANAPIANSLAYENADWGIEAVGPDNDGGGNRAWSNGQPDQCLYVVCGPGPPASLTLSPASATNEVGGRHCVTATSVDPDGRPTSGLTVRFSVVGDPGGNTAEGEAVTDDLGQAQFCYAGPVVGPSTDEITAFVDSDGDGTPAFDEPGGSAEKLWVLPSSSADCKLSGSATLVAANGDRARAHVSVRSSGESAPSGRHSYVDYGPAESLVVRSITVESLVCDSSGTATLFGEARTNRSGTVLYRIDVMDGGSGRKDTYRIRLSSGYDSGEAPLTTGNFKLR